MRYFDKTFWKMCVGFIAILSVSLIFIMATRAYQSDQASKQNAQNNVQYQEMKHPAQPTH